LSIPRGPSVVATVCATARHAEMLDKSCGVPCEVSVPSTQTVSSWNQAESLPSARGRSKNVPLRRTTVGCYSDQRLGQSIRWGDVPSVGVGPASLLSSRLGVMCSDEDCARDEMIDDG
jgi:hypothetical protein